MSLERILKNLIESLPEDGKAPVLDDIKKIASKVGNRHAKGLNWSHAERALREMSGSDNQEINKDLVQKKVISDPLFNNEYLNQIEDINLDKEFAEGFLKRLNKKERIFLELGLFLDQNFDVSSTMDYLMESDKGKVKKPGDLSEVLMIDISSKSSILEGMSELTRLQLEWHEEMRNKVDLSDRYMTNEVIHEFDDGWKIVYVPAIGEGPDYKGNSSKSNDRTVEGNKCGLCLGEHAGLYQTNSSGRIYSVRDPENNPKVTIRILDNELVEAKGKNNLPPGIEGVAHAKEWFKLLRSNDQSFEYESNNDFKKFPPSSLEEAAEVWRRIQTSDSVGAQQMREDRSRNPFWSKGWITSWYRNGIKELDEEVNKAVEEGDYELFQSGFANKYPELCEGAARKYLEELAKKPRMRGRRLAESLDDNTGRFSFLKTYKSKEWMVAFVKDLFENNKFKPQQLHDYVLKRRWHFIDEIKDLVEQSAHSHISHLASQPDWQPQNTIYRWEVFEAYPDLRSEYVRRIKPSAYFKQAYQYEPQFEDEIRDRWLHETLVGIELMAKDPNIIKLYRSMDNLRSETKIGAPSPALYGAETRRSLLSFGENYDLFNILKFSGDKERRAISEKLIEVGLSDLLFLSLSPEMAAGWVPKRWKSRVDARTGIENENYHREANIEAEAVQKKTPTLAHIFPDLLTEDVARNLAKNSPEIYFEETDKGRGQALLLKDENISENSQVAIIKYVASARGRLGGAESIKLWQSKFWKILSRHLFDQSGAPDEKLIRRVIEGVAARSMPTASGELPDKLTIDDDVEALYDSPEIEGLFALMEILKELDNEALSPEDNSAIAYKDILIPLFKAWAYEYPYIYLAPEFEGLFMLGEYPEIKNIALQRVVLKDKDKPYSEENTDAKSALKTIVDSGQYKNPEFIELYAREYPDHFLHHESGTLVWESTLNQLDQESRQKYREIAVESLAEKNPDIFLDNDYNVEFPEFESIARHAMMKMKGHTHEISWEDEDEDPEYHFDPRVELLGEDVGDISEEEYIEKMSRRKKLLRINKAAKPSRETTLKSILKASRN